MEQLSFINCDVPGCTEKSMFGSWHCKQHTTKSNRNNPTPPDVVGRKTSSESKDTNPKDAVGVKKVPMSVLSGPVLMEVGLGMMEGARKYGRHNYRVAGVRGSVYFDAAMRHLWLWYEGQDIDVESGLNHISKAMSALHVMRDAMLNDKFTDDRPPKFKDQEWVSNFNKLAAGIIEKYPDSVEPYTELKTATG